MGCLCSNNKSQDCSQVLGVAESNVKGEKRKKVFNMRDCDVVKGRCLMYRTLIC